jgi:hypothetical protein
MLSNKLIGNLFKNRLFNNLLRKNLTTEFDSRIFSLDPRYKNLIKIKRLLKSYNEIFSVKD